MYVNKRLTLARENYAREIIADMIDYEIKQAFTIKPKNVRPSPLRNHQQGTKNLRM